MASEQPPSYNPECNNVTEGGNFDAGNMYASEGQLKATTPKENISVPLDIPPPDYEPVNNNNNYNEPLIPNANASRADRSRGQCCKRFFMGATVFWIISIILLSIGSNALEENLKFNKVAKKTTCTIQSYTQKECSYDCNCHKDGDGHESCSTCYGLEYEYLVTSDLCDGSKLHQQNWDDNGACPQRLKPVGHSQKCWVHCEELEYSWSSPGLLIAVSIVLLVIGVCCWCCGCACGSASSAL